MDDGEEMGSEADDDDIWRRFLEGEDEWSDEDMEFGADDAEEMEGEEEEELEEMDWETL